MNNIFVEVFMKKLILIFLIMFTLVPKIYADETSSDEVIVGEQKEVKENEEVNNSPINLKSQSGIIMEISTKKVLFINIVINPIANIPTKTNPIFFATFCIPKLSRSTKKYG